MFLTIINFHSHLQLNEFFDALYTLICLRINFFLYIRKLRHPYIVKFYGTSLLKDDGKTRVILVVEKCEQNLRSRLHEKPQRCPGKASNPGVFGEVCQWVIQITDALDYIHQQEIIHRDLKLENILVCKIAFVLIFKVARVSTSFFCGISITKSITLEKYYAEC